ncbi:MAG: cyclic nucleotide-binding domain-containing protein, partial [Bacteroidota bacterium]|nr:cyclic nucleotide-binding domain-containing protein [Bacteroidota bacterium]
MQNNNTISLNYKKRIEVLKRVDIFAEANVKFLKKLASSLKEIFLEKDEIVFLKGDKYSAMYIIVEGEVKIHDNDYVFTHFKKNEIFGEYSLIDSSERSASVTAVKESSCLVLEKDVFDSLIEEDNKIALEILKSLIRRLRNNNVLEEKLVTQNQKIIEQRNRIDKQRKELEEMNLSKDKFFTIIAHDLKNPFNTVIGLSELIINRYDSYDREKIKFFIEQINLYSNNTYELLENLLQWSRSQTGKLKVKLEKVNLQNISTEIKYLYAGKTEEKQIEIINKVNFDTNVYADSNMLNTVLRNLVSNALKFTPQNGKITISDKI